MRSRNRLTKGFKNIRSRKNDQRKKGVMVLLITTSTYYSNSLTQYAIFKKIYCFCPKRSSLSPTITSEQVNVHISLDWIELSNQPLVQKLKHQKLFQMVGSNLFVFFLKKNYHLNLFKNFSKSSFFNIKSSLHSDRYSLLQYPPLKKRLFFLKNRNTCHEI